MPHADCPSVPDDPELDRLYREYEIAWAHAIGCPMLGYSKTLEDDKRLEEVKKKIEKHTSSKAYLYGVTGSFVDSPFTGKDDKTRGSASKVNEND